MCEEKIVKYGTPVIDGTFKDIYRDTYCYIEKPLERLSYCPLGQEAAEKYMPRTDGHVYYLYDDEYLYICAVIHDETICTRGREWRMNTVWPWNDDGAEIYLWFSDEDCMAIHSDAHGFRSVVDEHIWGLNHDSARTYHDTPREDWAATIDTEKQNYTIELRVKLPSYVGEGSKVGTLLEIDDRWAVGEGTEDMIAGLFAYPRFPGADNFLLTLGKKP